MPGRGFIVFEQKKRSVTEKMHWKETKIHNVSKKRDTRAQLMIQN